MNYPLKFSLAKGDKKQIVGEEINLMKEITNKIL